MLPFLATLMTLKRRVNIISVKPAPLPVPSLFTSSGKVEAPILISSSAVASSGGEGGGGGGCAINQKAGFDPVLWLMTLFSLFYLVGKRETRVK